MYFSAEVILPFLALISYAVLFLIVTFSKPKTSAKYSFRTYLLAMAVWSFAALFIRFTKGGVLFWFRMMTSGALASMLALYQFIQDMLYRKYKLTSVVYVYGLISILLVQFTSYAIPYASIRNGVLEYEFTDLIALIAGPGYLLMFFNWTKLFQAYQHSRDSTQKNRLRFLLIGISIIIIGSTVNFTELGKYPIDIGANLVAAFLITYAILRHRLLDINVVIRKSVLYAIPTIVIGAWYFTFITISFNLFQTNTTAELFSLSLVVSVIAALIFQPLRDVMQRWIDKLFFRERYNVGQMLQRVSQTASAVIDIDQLARIILSEVTDTLHIQKAALFLSNNGHKNLVIASQKGMTLPPRTLIAHDHPLVNWMDENENVLTKHILETDHRFHSMWSQEIDVINTLEAEMFIPLKAQGDLVGLISLGPKMSEQPYTGEDQQTLLTLANQTAVGVRNAQLFYSVQKELVQRRETEKRLQLQLKRLSALQNISIAITTNIDLQIPLFLLLEQVTDELGVDAADVLLYDEGNKELFFVAGRGFTTDALKYTRLDLGQGLAGKAAETLEIVRIDNLFDEDTSLKQSPHLANEGFYAYFGVPLIAKSKLQGVLELFHRSPMEPDQEWMDFLDTLTAETAIAVDNAQLFKDLEKSNLDLALAYETTLEGWAKTLELRDRETEGHSQRVLDLTVKIAQKLGVKQEEMIHIKRGSLLHDIGKMGVPDSILLKDGPLDKEEWDIMKKHPEFAYQMLSTIPFLENALEIPHCHHEKWDGTGYPQELKGDEIPLSARIFAIVDVWDALRSDRPYRKAWTDRKALDHIQSESGKHFDPMVVNVFLDSISIENRNSRKK